MSTPHHPTLKSSELIGYKKTSLEIPLVFFFGGICLSELKSGWFMKTFLRRVASCLDDERFIATST